MNEMSFFSDNLVDVFAMTMIHSIWQGAIIVLIVGMTLKLLPRLQAQLQYSVFLAGLMSLLIAVIATFSIQMIGDTNDTSPILQRDLIPERTFVTGITEQTFVFSWQEAAALIWFLGSMIFLLRALVGTLQIWKIRKNSYKADLEWQWLISSLQRKLKINQKVKILVSDDCLIPFVWGVFKSVIVVPSMYFTRLSQQEIESILLHELTHIRRRDFLVNLVQIIIESLLFFNPATWWLSGQMKRQREFCCDDSVQQQMSNQSTYLKALYKVALFSINERPDYSIALFKQNSELIMRMKRMLNTPVRHTGNQTIFTASIGVLVVGLMFTLDVAFGQQSETTKEDVKNKVEIYKHEVKPGEQKIVITPVVSPKVNVTSVSPETDMHVSVAPMLTSMEVASPVIRVHPVIKTQVAPVVSQVDVQISRPDVHIEVAPVIATNLHFSVVDSPVFAHDTLPTSPRIDKADGSEG